MTLKEFFRKARTGRTWRLTPRTNTSTLNTEYLVRCEQGYCPLGAVAYSPGDVDYWGKVPLVGSALVRDLKLPKGAARKIANAADKERSRNRPWLLKNLGVSHTPTPEPRT